MEKLDGRGSCKWHPRKQGEGVCAWCLRESLIKLVASQGRDEDTSSLDEYQEKFDSKVMPNGGRKKEGDSQLPLVQLWRSKSVRDEELAKNSVSGVDSNLFPLKARLHGLKGMGAVDCEGGRDKQESARASDVQNLFDPYSISASKQANQAQTSRPRGKNSWKSAVVRINALKNAWGMFWKSERGGDDSTGSKLKAGHEIKGKLAAMNDEPQCRPGQSLEPSAANTDPKDSKRPSIGSRGSPFSSRTSLLKVNKKSVSAANSIEESSNKDSRAFHNLSTLEDFSRECIIEGVQVHNVDTNVVEESPRRSGFEGTQGMGYERTVEESCPSHTDVQYTEVSWVDDGNYNDQSGCAVDAKQSVPQSSNKASPWRMFSRSSSRRSPQTHLRSDERISIPNIFKFPMSRSKSVRKSQVASPPPDSKQVPHSSKLSPWSRTVSRSSSKWSPFSSNSEMRGEAALFPDESPGRLKSVLHTQSASSSPYVSKPEAAKHSSQSSKTSPWSSNLSRPSSKASPLILSSSAHTRDQTDNELMGEALRYRLDPDGEISQFLQSRFQA